MHYRATTEGEEWGEKWHFWEWLAGSAVLTQNLQNNDLVCGPPIDYNTGWNLF